VIISTACCWHEAASEVERKEFMRAFIERIELFPEKQPDGNWIRKIIFNFPVPVNGTEVTELPLENETTVETICLLSKLNAKQHIEINLDMDELDLTDAEKKATYQEIKDYVLEHSGLKVSSLYIAQVKQKCGIIERENYNKPKSEDAKQPQCPPDKEKAIKEALTHFGMI
jgi:site-specific DNA recombinase